MAKQDEIDETRCVACGGPLVLDVRSRSAILGGPDSVETRCVYCRRIDTEKLSIQEVFDQLRPQVEKGSEGLDYFHLSMMLRPEYRLREGGDLLRPEDLFPGQSARWIACYVVTGDNEGHYVHVDAIRVNPDGMRTAIPLYLAKTFGGMEDAQRIAFRCAELLGA